MYAYEQCYCISTFMHVKAGSIYEKNNVDNIIDPRFDDPLTIQHFS